MSAQQHSIQRQVLNVRFAKRDEHHLLYESVKSIYQQHIQHRIAAYFDQIASTEQHLIIDRLTLDIGSVAVKDLEDSLPDRILEQLEHQLMDVVYSTAASPKKEEALQRKSKAKACTEAFMFFLLSGQFPWWYPSEKMAVFETKIIEHKDSSRSSLLLKVLQQPKASKRLIYQFSDDFFIKMMKGFQTKVHVQEINQPLSHSKKLQILEDLRSNPKPQNESLQNTFNTQKVSNSGLSIKAQYQRFEKAIEEGIYIQNAGVVLLWVYLKPFFETLGLLKKGIFLNLEAQQRAALLLQYLCTGNTQNIESDLLLNKILCGIPMDDPLPATIELTEEEHRECQELLQTMIKHWEALKSTSPETLQETFLQREGKLSSVDGGWLLQIEAQAYDILLSQLPWAISMIHLPWMTEMVWGEWN